MRVLFIGNSYIFVNDMPQIFADLVQAGGYEAIVETAAKGGWTLADHASSDETQKLISDGTWDYVVLQEQSIISSIEHRRNAEMAPAAKALVEQITDVGALPLFFMTWGRRDGLPEFGFDSFSAMQNQLQQGYTEIAGSLDARVVPVGLAWQQGLGEDPAMPLWDNDGSHPSVEGSYLTACVFYAVIVQGSPESLNYDAGIPVVRARLLQRIAAETVMTEY